MITLSYLIPTETNPYPDYSHTLQLAINQAEADPSLTVFIPSGYHQITRPMFVDFSGLRIVGESPQSIIAMQPGIMSPVLVFGVGIVDAGGLSITGDFRPRAKLDSSVSPKLAYATLGKSALMANAHPAVLGPSPNTKTLISVDQLAFSQLSATNTLLQVVGRETVKGFQPGFYHFGPMIETDVVHQEVNSATNWESF